MRPVRVYYERSAETAKALQHPDRLIVTSLSAELFDQWRQRLEHDERTDCVVLGGPAVCTGWRIFLDRPVQFVEGPTVDERHAAEQRQASVRIVQRGKLFPEVFSPYNLVQEHLERDIYYPWRVLVSCILLNQASGRQVRPIVGSVFELVKGPDYMVYQVPVGSLVDVLKPLGLQNVRARRILELSADYLQRIPLKDMRGVGQYAVDAFRLFCEGRTDIEPTDTWLKPYLEWRKSGGPAVDWPKDDFHEWWMAGSA